MFINIQYNNTRLFVCNEQSECVSSLWDKREPESLHCLTVTTVSFLKWHEVLDIKPNGDHYICERQKPYVKKQIKFWEVKNEILKGVGKKVDYFVLASAFIERDKNGKCLQYYGFICGLKCKEKNCIMPWASELHYVRQVRGWLPPYIFYSITTNDPAGLN